MRSGCGLRLRAGELVALELGPASNRNPIPPEREIIARRWTILGPGFATWPADTMEAIAEFAPAHPRTNLELRAASVGASPQNLERSGGVYAQEFVGFPGQWMLQARSGRTVPVALQPGYTNQDYHLAMSPAGRTACI